MQVVRRATIGRRRNQDLRSHSIAVVQPAQPRKLACERSGELQRDFRQEVESNLARAQSRRSDGNWRGTYVGNIDFEHLSQKSCLLGVCKSLNLLMRLGRFVASHN